MSKTSSILLLLLAPIASIGLVLPTGNYDHRRQRAPLMPVFLPDAAAAGSSGSQAGGGLAEGNGPPLIERCTLRYRNSTLDHYDLSDTRTYAQRYFVCLGDWRFDKRGRPGPFFLYAGNEADVTLYLNASGLMWESANEFGAALVFAEHRFYGASRPFPGQKLEAKTLRYLSSDQALADYAELITDLKRELSAEHAPVVVFGGSYGGMLASWMRMKYPHVVDGAIAGSAPIWSFFGEEPAYDAGSFAKTITYAASPKAGSAERCVPNARQGWKEMFRLGQDQGGRDSLHAALRLCDGVPLKSPGQVLEAAYWLQSSWDYMAMGNFPYASTYILNGRGELPAWPIRAACDKLKGDGMSPEQLVAALGAASAVFYNASRPAPGPSKRQQAGLQCFDYRAAVNDETREDGELWDWQSCTEMFMPFSRDGEADMFWAQPFDERAAVAECRREWGVEPRVAWPTLHYGGSPRLDAASNIVFSNGAFDPWKGGGVLRGGRHGVEAIVIREAAHHLDLMFSHPGDTPYVQQARQQQRDHMARWIEHAWRRFPGDGSARVHVTSDASGPAAAA